MKKNTDEWVVSKNLPEFPVKWLRPLGKLPVGAMPSVALKGKLFVIEDLEISVIILIGNDKKTISSCFVDSQSIRANLKFAFDSAVDSLSTYENQSVHMPIIYYWESLKTILSHEYGINWKTPCYELFSRRTFGRIGLVGFFAI